jgi:hypothetical protein
MLGKEISWADRAVRDFLNTKNELTAGNTITASPFTNATRSAMAY